ncbi:hypothetical protein BSG18_10490 [Pseudomonas ogarae]|nr:hypothetical protein BSG18_10490 [Pseudomonas ogarae]
MKYIQRHLTEPDLSIEVIAQAHNVSTRTVTRAFARYQKTSVAEIWKERLNASREAIERGQVRFCGGDEFSVCIFYIAPRVVRKQRHGYSVQVAGFASIARAVTSNVQDDLYF